VRLQGEGEDYQASSHRANSNSATFAKDGKRYWPEGIGTPHMRK
jgi:hypothetical protein